MGFAVLCNSACIQSLPRRSIYFNNQKHSQSSKLPRISRAFLVRKFTSTLFVTNFQVTDRKRACNSVFQRLPASLGNEVTIEEPSANTETGPNVDLGVDDPSKEDEDTDSSEAIMAESISPDSSSDSKQSKSTGSFRRNSNPQIKDEELVPGAIFTGKVRSIQSYGAFVELGASIQGLAHISRLSKDYVKNVSDIVSLGQEVTVKIVEANLESGRIALTMLLDDTKEQEGKKQDSDGMANHKGPARSSKHSDNDAQINSKFHKGQEFEGQVKAFVRGGALIELPENEEGFLPTSELADDYTSLNGEMLLTRSQKVKVKVLRVDKGRIRLTMKLNKKEVRVLEENDVLVADNPFELAFRKHPVISAFLKEKESQLSKNSLDEASNLVVSPNDEVESSNNNLSFNPALENIQAKVSNESTGKDETSSLAASEGSVVSSDAKPEEQFLNAANDHNLVNGRYEDVNDVPDNRLKETPTSMPNTIANESISYGVSDTLDSTVNPHAVTKSERQESSPNKRKESVTSTISLTLVKQLREETGAGMMNCKNALVETAGDLEKARDLLRKKGLASAEKKASRVAAEGRIGSYIHDNRIGVMLEVNCETDFVSRGDIFRELVEDLAMQIAACPQVQYVAAEDVPDHIVQKEKEIEMQKEDLASKPEQIREKIVEGRIRKIVNELTLLEQPYIKNDKLIIKDLVKQNIATLGENIQVRRFVRYNLGEGLEKKNQDFAAEVAAQTAGSPSVPIPLEGQKASEMSSTAADEAKSEQSKETVTISASLVRQLRAETGAGMMDCKKALSETGGDLVAAQEVLRKKGLASAEKKSGRIAAEGRVGSYIHDNRIGVLVELNCETDFVARGDAFKELVQDLAMQAVASPQTQCVSIDDIPKEIVDKEREIEMEKEDLQSKPEQLREKIVEGRLTKRLGELALLEQPFLRNDKILVKDVIKQSVATLGENIRLRRFVRYNLGEGVEKETKDLATEIAEQTKTTSEG